MTNLQLINERPTAAYKKLIGTQELKDVYGEYEASMPLPPVHTMLEERQRTARILKIMVLEDHIRA